MKAQIISDNNLFKKSLQRYLKNIFTEDLSDLILVDVNVFGPHPNKSVISMIKEYSSNKENIIILGFENEKYLLADDPDFSLLMSLSNVGFVDILKLNNIIAEYNRLTKGEKKEDKIGIEIYSYQLLEREIGILRHNLNYALSNPKEMESWLKKAKTVGLDGTQEQIISQVKNWTPQTSGAFDGKYLEGIFVDALDTLFDKDWHLFTEVRKAIEKMAKGKKELL